MWLRVRKTCLIQKRNSKGFNRIIVIADAAHSFGAKVQNVAIGNIADFTCFSFHAVKNLTTGEGGAVTWKENATLNDDELYKNICF